MELAPSIAQTRQECPEQLEVQGVRRSIEVTSHYDMMTCLQTLDGASFRQQHTTNKSMSQPPLSIHMNETDCCQLVHPVLMLRCI